MGLRVVGIEETPLRFLSWVLIDSNHEQFVI
jgi:hypothetical protein